MQIETQKQLKPFNTLSLNAIASHYVQIHSPDELVEALDYAQQHA
jgi:UDP-N-acetylmuramate dehydrogenase